MFIGHSICVLLIGVLRSFGALLGVKDCQMELRGFHVPWKSYVDVGTSSRRSSFIKQENLENITENRETEKCRTEAYMNSLHFLVLTDGWMRLYQIDIEPRGLVIDI